MNGGNPVLAKRFWRVFLILILVGVVSVTGFMALEGLPFPKAMYLSVATLTTVGYGDLVPMTELGRWFSLLVMLSGVSLGFYAVGLLAATLVEGSLFQLVEERRMRKTIEALRNHFIICGYGQVGKLLASELSGMNADFVVVERDPGRCAVAREDGYLAIQGDATDEVVLTEARVELARGLATVISDDAENLYITVSSRSLHPDLPIVARASRTRGGRYLTQAGATSVIFLDRLGASRIARSLLRPDVVMFLEQMMGSQQGDLQLEALKLPQKCGLAGQTIKELELRPRYGLQVLAIKSHGQYLPNPGPEQVVQEEDVLVVVGTSESLARFADELEREIR